MDPVQWCTAVPCTDLQRQRELEFVPLALLHRAQHARQVAPPLALERALDLNHALGARREQRRQVLQQLVVLRLLPACMHEVREVKRVHGGARVFAGCWVHVMMCQLARADGDAHGPHVSAWKVRRL